MHRNPRTEAQCLALHSEDLKKAPLVAKCGSYSGTKLQLGSFGNTRLRGEGFAAAAQQVEKFAAKDFWLRIQKILSSNIEFFLGWDLFLASFPQSPLNKKALAQRRWLATEHKIRGNEIAASLSSFAACIEILAGEVLFSIRAR